MGAYFVRRAQAHGVILRVLGGDVIAFSPPLVISESVELDDAVDNLEPLAFLLRGLLDRAVSRLGALCQACGDFTLHLDLEPRGSDHLPFSLRLAIRPDHGERPAHHLLHLHRDR